MVQAPDQCAVCQSFVDLEDLFCSCCGTEAPRPDAQQLEILEVSSLHFACRGCGASMNYDAGAAALRCPFCGSVDLKEQSAQGLVRPDTVVPFRIQRAAMERSFRDWCGRGFWRPADLASAARLTEITPIYIPFWVFDADTHGYWTADSDVTPSGASGDWFPLFGEHRDKVKGVLVPASGGLRDSELEAVAPFDFALGVDPEDIDREGVTLEKFAVSRKYARPLARRLIRERLREVCRRYVPGRARNVSVNVLFRHMVGRPVLLPFWVLAYRYRDEIYRFVANGQTGKRTGKAPFSWAKLLMVLVGFGVLAGVGLLVVLS